MQRKKYEDALESFNHVIEKDKNNLSTLTNLGHCYYFLKRFDEAEQTYLKAIQVSTITGQTNDDPYLQDRLGTIYLQSERLDLAQRVFDDCLLQPTYSSYALFNNAITYIPQSNYNWDAS